MKAMARGLKNLPDSGGRLGVCGAFIAILRSDTLAKGRITVCPFGMPFSKLLSTAYRAVNK
jgi:hypothetical protein